MHTHVRIAKIAGKRELISAVAKHCFPIGARERDKAILASFLQNQNRKNRENESETIGKIFADFNFQVLQRPALSLPKSADRAHQN